MDLLFERFVEHLVVHGSRLDLTELCRGHSELRGPLERRIAGFDQVDELLRSRRRLRPGSLMGAYRIVRQLGEGAMGCVYLAVDTRNDTRIALKTCPPDRAADLETRRRFEREAAIIAALEHPNIVRYLSLEVHQECLFLTMELVEGETLATPSPRRTLRSERLLAVGRSLADALRATHARGVVHRDLKPSNLMWTTDGRLKVLDFGLAHLATPADVESLTRTGCVLGTIAYMAPEQLLGERPSPCSDVYSFGAVLYELATGRRPFAGGHLGEILEAIFEQAPPPLIGERPDLPLLLIQVVERCLARDPAQRPRDGADLVSELDRVSAGTADPSA